MPQNIEIIDVKPQNVEVVDQKPVNAGNIPSTEQLYTITLQAGMLIPLGGITYATTQTILSPYSP